MVVHGMKACTDYRCVHHPPGGDCTAGGGHVRRGGLYVAEAAAVIALTGVVLPLLGGVAVAWFTRGFLQANAGDRSNEWFRPFDIGVGVLVAVVVVSLAGGQVLRWRRKRAGSTCRPAS